MNTFREMVLISMDEYKRQRKQNLFSHTGTSAPTMQKELHELSDDIPDDQRVKLEHEIISKHSGSQSNPAKQPQNEIFIRILESFGNTNKRRSIQVFNHLMTFYKHRPKWNDLGQILDGNNEPIHGSNIVDLIDSITGAINTRKLPIGFGSFVNAIRESNLPMQFLSKTGLHRLNSYKHENTIADGDMSDEVEDEPESKWEELFS
jgi:hypothetical protein